MNEKRQPYDRTVLTETVITLADKTRRNLVKKMSQASTVKLDGAFQQGDANVSSANPLLLNNIANVVAVYSFEPFLVDIRAEGQEITGLKCSGKFIWHGNLELVVISPAQSGTVVRLFYLAS